MKTDEVKAKVMTAWVRTKGVSAAARASRASRPPSNEASEVWRAELECKCDEAIVTVIENEAWTTQQRKLFRMQFRDCRRQERFH